MGKVSDFLPARVRFMTYSFCWANKFHFGCSLGYSSTDTHQAFGENMRRTELSNLGATWSQSDEDFFLTTQELTRIRLEPDKRLTSVRAEGNDFRRSHKRFVRSISVSIQPLDDDFQPCSNIFWVVSRDISMRGMGLISHEPFFHRYVRLGLIEQSVSTIAEVKHNTSIGDRYPLFLVGVNFEGRLLDANGEINPR